MAEKRLKIELENPRVYITSSGSLYVSADEIFHSRVGQDIILRMAEIEPLPKTQNEAKTTSGLPPKDD